jgi:hypothetical protein
MMVHLLKTLMYVKVNCFKFGSVESKTVMSCHTKKQNSRQKSKSRLQKA